MWLQACLNGSRTSSEHAVVPLTPAALAEDARRVLAAGAVSFDDVLGEALPQVPRLIHGTDEAVWPLLERAMRGGHVSRIGLEDTLLLPSGEVANDNAALVRAAKSLISPSVA